MFGARAFDDAGERDCRGRVRRMIDHRFMIVRGVRVHTALPVLHPRHPAHFGADCTKTARPDIGPRQRGEQQDEREARDPEAGDGVKVAQRGACAERQARPHHPREPAPARPPEIKAGQDHHDRPARGKLDQQAARAADQQAAVDRRQPRR